MLLTQKELVALRQRGEELSEQIIQWRRAFHAEPELQMETPKTEARIVKILKEIGVDQIRSGVGGHGVCAIIEGSLPGKCLGIRADCDGLPIKEETGLPFASHNGNMHACGHDAHTAMALGAAKLLVEHKHHLVGSVKLIFQPYEEGDGGAKLMIADHVLENPKVDAIIALHNNCTPDSDYQLGDVLVLDQPMSANIYAYEATFHGPGAHVCLSRKTSNAVYMACNAVSRIAALPEPGPETVNAVTMVHGGVRNNVIPETCTIAGSIRAFDSALHHLMQKQVHEILEQSAAENGGRVEIVKTIDLMGTEIDQDLYQRFCAISDQIYPERSCRSLTEREMVGEDFARFAARVPAMFFMLHTRPQGSYYPLHHPKFDVDESVLHKASILFSSFALNWQSP